MNKNNSGFSAVELVIILVVVGVIGAVGFMVMGRKNSSGSSGFASANWTLAQSGWKANGTPPACSDPLLIPSPTDTTKAVSILYPGQYRGGNYKPHGGFRFADGTNDSVTVTLPLDAQLYKGSRYGEQGETQYLLGFINSCGIMFKFDHLDTLSADFKKVVDDNLPPAKDNDSRTTSLVSKNLNYKAGTVIATGVGFKKTNNSVFDFGVYDLRKKNTISANAEWAAKHTDDNEYAPYAICWLDILGNTDSARVKALPASDPTSNTISDVCTTSAGNTLTNTVGNPGSAAAAASAAASSAAGGGDGSGASSSSGSGTTSTPGSGNGSGSVGGSGGGH